MPKLSDEPAGRSRRGAKAFFAAGVSGQILALVRNVMLARILGPDQFGIAMTLVLTAQFLEALTDSGNDKFLVQDPSGDEPQVQQMAQFIALARGCVMAVALAALSGPLANFYGDPRLSSGFLILAVAPLVSGFLHLDMRRLQRSNNFIPESAVIFLGELASCLVAIVAAAISQSFAAVIFGLAARSLTMVVVSHLVSERSYRVGLVRSESAKFWSFGWPLLINGPLLFFGAQGDRVLISSQLGLRELGLYSAALLLLSSPSSMLTRYLAGIHFPVLAAARFVPAQFSASEVQLRGQLLALAIAMAFGYAMLGPFVLRELYGPDFAQSLLIIGLIGSLGAIRLLRTWPATVSFSVGQSEGILAGNLIRIVALPAGFAGIALVGGLTGVVTGFLVGEVFALFGAVMLLNRRLHRSVVTGFISIGAMLLTGTLILTVGLMSGDKESLDLVDNSGILSVLAIVLFVLLCVTLAKEHAALRAVTDAWRHLRRRLIVK